MKKVYIIGFDGMHRSGKGSQIRLLQDHFNLNNTPYIILRGDGTRAGRGPSLNAPYDYKSLWWQNNLAYFKEKPADLEEALYKLNLKSQRLNREISAAKYLLEKSDRHSFILLDRTFISRFFTMKQFVPEIDLPQSLEIYCNKTKRRVEFVIPDISFVLHTTKENLMLRIKTMHDGSERYDFKEHIVNNYFTLFEEVLNKIRDFPYIRILDSNKNPNDLHHEILAGIVNLTENER